MTSIRTHSVVIVDDHPAICQALRATLERSGRFEVVAEAGDGAAAWSAIRERVPALVILDLDLPGIDGLGILERIKRAHRSVKVLVFSAQEEGIFASRAMQKGADGFLSKSCELRGVLEAATSVMSGGSVFPASALPTMAKSAVASQAELLGILSDRELIVLRHLVSGKNQREIGELMRISSKTVSTFKRKIFEKLGMSTLVELVDFARDRQLV